MERIAAVVGIGLALGLAGPAASQGKVPVEKDLRRFEGVERRIEADRADAPAARPSLVGSPANPSGVPGFQGGPGAVGSSVGSYAPLPPGAPGNEIQ